MKQILPAMVFLALMTASCKGSGRPVPTRPTAPSPPPAAAGVRLTGTVTDDDGHGVANAAISVDTRRVIGLTDAGGRYDASLEGVPFSNGYLSASKDGFERNDQFVDSQKNPVQDFRLRRIVNLTPGSSRQVEIVSADSLCGLASEWRCQSVRITPPRRGTLTLEVTPGSPGELVGVEVFRPYSCCSSNVSIPAAADVEMQVNVLVPWNAPLPRTVTLKTGFTPE